MQHQSQTQQTKKLENLQYAFFYCSSSFPSVSQIIPLPFTHAYWHGKAASVPSSWSNVVGKSLECRPSLWSYNRDIAIISSDVIISNVKYCINSSQGAFSLTV